MAVPGEARQQERRRSGLPLGPEWASEDEYVQSLLTFATSSVLFRNLCGGVHILDFLTREPDLYTTVLPKEWRDWFDQVSEDEVLDLLLRQDLARYADLQQSNDQYDSGHLPHPPESLLAYVKTVRKHCLRRDFVPVSGETSTATAAASMPAHIAVGMKTKKIHEVANFAAYVSDLSAKVSEQLQQEISIVDFGSGQNYLGRTLASPPYHKHVIAIESKHHNITGAKGMDVHAKLAKKEKIMRNKKEWKRRWAASRNSNEPIPTPPAEENCSEEVEGVPTPTLEREQEPVPVPDAIFAAAEIMPMEFDPSKGSMTYIEHEVRDGRLEDILYPGTVDQEDPQPENETANSLNPNDQQDGMEAPPHHQPPGTRPKAMVVSLHSCGNLSHHGIRSLILNPSVCAVAMIGCCYNLLTERLGPATYKLPRLRPNHPRLEATGSAYDPHGFPMSRTLEDFEHGGGGSSSSSEGDDKNRGVKLNITARMMAVQAPYNWGPEDSEAFFRRHFYRALLQRVLLDVGVVKQSPDPAAATSATGNSITGKDEQGTPLIVGSLRKACFASFRAYVRGALAKLRADPVDGPSIAELTRGLDDDAVVDAYEARWGYARKNLAIIWSLIAFSAGVVESIIVVDRWLYLREQPCVQDCWVDIVFDYKLSPRNFVVVGIKKPD